MKLYQFRHQAAGVLSDVILDHPPTPEEVKVLMDRCEQAHGKTHPKTGLPYWYKVLEVDTSKPLTSLLEPESSTDSGASASEFVVNGVGHVKNP